MSRLCGIQEVVRGTEEGDPRGEKHKTPIPETHVIGTDTFSRLTVVGIVILIVSGSFVNIASMLGLIPVSGIPLMFISHGGTALFIALASVGIILSISRQQSA